MAQERAFIGRGWSFPPSFDNKTGTVKMVTDEQDIAEGLQILLATRPGERIMQPSYGCNLDVLLFESLTTTLITYVEELIRTAILYHEPRIALDRVKINTENAFEGVVLIEIDYTTLNFNSRFNLVYPFYLEEGTDVNLPIRQSDQIILSAILS